MDSELDDVLRLRMKERLRDAICEYFSDLYIEELAEDLKEVVSLEEHHYRERANKIAMFNLCLFVNKTVPDNE